METQTIQMTQNLAPNLNKEVKGGMNKMKNTYNLIGNKVKGYLASAVLAGALTFGGYSAQAANLPINPETKSAIVQVSEKYKGLEQEVTDSFNQAISDGKFDLKEQREVYGSLKGLRTYAKEHGVTISSGLGEISSGLKHNLYGIDLGKAELQKTMEKEGIPCYVEHDPSSELTIGAFGALAVLGYLLLKFPKRRPFTF
jgi:hypothetical protein